jgi:hypothetical protein
MFPHFAAALRKIPRGKFHRLTFQFGSHRITPSVKPPDQRNHSDYLDDLILAEVVAEFDEVRWSRRVRNDRGVASQPQSGGSGLIEMAVGFEQPGGFQSFQRYAHSDCRGGGVHLAVAAPCASARNVRHELLEFRSNIPLV